MTYRDVATTRILVASATLLFLFMCVEAALSTWVTYLSVDAEIRFVSNVFDLRPYERMFVQISRDGLRSIALAHVMSLVLLGACFAGMALSHSRGPATWKAGALFLAFLFLPVGSASTWMVQTFVDLDQGDGTYASATWSREDRMPFGTPVHGSAVATMSLVERAVDEGILPAGIANGTSFEASLERGFPILVFHLWLSLGNVLVGSFVSVLLVLWSVRLAWIGRPRRRRTGDAMSV